MGTHAWTCLVFTHDHLLSLNHETRDSPPFYHLLAHSNTSQPSVYVCASG